VASPRYIFYPTIFLQIFQGVVNASLFLFFIPLVRGFESWEVRDVKKISRCDIFRAVSCARKSTV